MTEQGPYILDADNRPVLSGPGKSYQAWVRSLQASEEWRWGGKAFETIFLKNDWLPKGQGSLVTMFEPYAQVDADGPRVFKTTITIGPVENSRFVSVTGNRCVTMATYHTREQAIAGHEAVLRKIETGGLQSVMPSVAGDP